MPTTIRLDEALEERYARLAEKTGRSRSYYYKEALAEAIDRLEYENALLMDAADYRAGRVKTYSLAEVGEILGLDN